MRADELIRAYERKSDDELLHLAEQSGELTPEALSVLRAEIFRRRLDGSALDQPSETHEELAPTPSHSSTNVGSVNQFLLAVTRMYRDHFWLFIKLTAPAVVISYLTITLIRYLQHQVAATLTTQNYRS